MEKVENEAVKGSTKKYEKREPKKKISTRIPYHNFDESPVFIGRPVGEEIGKDDKGKEKSFGIIFQDEDGDRVLIDGKAIRDILKMEIEVVNENGETENTTIDESQPLMQIEFLGKKEIPGGKTFKEFEFSLLDEEETKD